MSRVGFSSRLQRVAASAIVLDKEFQDLVRRPSPDQQALLEESLFVYGCREPLIVWNCGGRLILLVGYERFPTLKLYKLPFRVVMKEFTSREEARLFMVRQRLARPNLSRLEVGYLRGLRCASEQRPKGGDRRSDSFRLARTDPRRTVEALAELFHVSPATMRRDQALAAAVERLVDSCGPQVRDLLLGQNRRLGRQGIIDLAELAEERQKAVIREWFVCGKLPRDWRGEEALKRISLPVEPRLMAQAVRRRLGAGFVAGLRQALNEQDTNDMQEAPPPAWAASAVVKRYWPAAGSEKGSAL